MTGSTGVIRRKVDAARAAVADGGPGADRGWRIALARAARDQVKLALDVSSLVLSRADLAEVLETPPERGLIGLLEGPGEGIGVMILAPEILQAVVEVLTLGKVGSSPLPNRKPTRTDAAMLAPLIDSALAGLEAALAQESDLVWAGGWRYASFLDDPRPLGLLLEDVQYRILRAEVSVAQGARSGPVLLILPAEGKGRFPTRAQTATPDEAMSGPAFAEALAEQVAASHSVLDAVVSRVTLPLARVLGLAVGDVLALPSAALDRVSFEGIDGRKLAEGKLGQNRGLRALRLAGPVLPVQKPTLVQPDLRQSA